MRITKEQQRRISNLILDNKFKPLYEAANKEQHELACKIYRSVVSEADEALADKIKAKHPRMINTINSWYLGKVDALGSFYIMLDSYRPYAELPTFFSMKEAQQNEVIAHYKKTADIIQANETDKQVLRATLARLNTVKKIQEEWPEIMPFVEQVVGQMTVANLPAVNKEDLNARFDLPVEEKQAA